MNTQKFCHKFLVPGLFWPISHYMHWDIDFNEQISSYRKAMNAKLSDFLVYSFIFILE